MKTENNWFVGDAPEDLEEVESKIKKIIPNAVVAAMLYMVVVGGSALFYFM